MINTEDFDSSFLKIDKMSYKNIGIYNIGYITIKIIDHYENIHSLNPFYLMVGKVDRYIEENSGNMNLVFTSANENKEVLKKYKELQDGIKNEFETINGRKTGKCGKDYMKIKLNNGDDLLLNKPSKFTTMTIVVRSVFEEDGKQCPQVYLDEYLYVL